MAILRTLYGIYGTGVAVFTIAALAVLLFGRSPSPARRAARAGALLVLGALWPVALLASRGRRRVFSILREHL